MEKENSFTELADDVKVPSLYHYIFVFLFGLNFIMLLFNLHL